MADLTTRVRAGFVAAGIPTVLIDELLESYVQAKERFYRLDLRPSAVEGGRFTEAALRIIEWRRSSRFTALGKQLKFTPTLMQQLENDLTQPDSVRMHIPRTLRVIYDVRNKRDTAHLGDGIDPNVQDATLVVRNIEWVMAELVRLYHNVSPDEAHAIIADLVSKEVPKIQVIDGYPRVLDTLRASDHCLVLLYWVGADGTTLTQLSAWLPKAMRANMRRTLAGLEGKHQIHVAGDKVQLTIRGENHVEQSKLMAPLSA